MNFVDMFIYYITMNFCMIRRVKVLRHGQITIPADLRRALRIREGMIALLKTEGKRIVIEFREPELPKVRIGKRIGLKDVRRLIEEGIGDKVARYFG